MSDPAAGDIFTGDAPPEAGWIAAEVREEFPALALHYTLVNRGSGRSTRDVKERLRLLSNRFYGSQVINMRNQPIPWAYRVFYRHIGLDPDEQRTPVEELALERMKHGGFPSRSLLDDALTIAIAESGVALRAFDAGRVTGRPGIRTTAAGEELEGRPAQLPSGTLVVADEQRPLSLLFGALAAGRGVSRKTKRIMLVAIKVSGVPDIAIEEALWLASSILTGE